MWWFVEADVASEKIARIAPGGGEKRGLPPESPGFDRRCREMSGSRQVDVAASRGRHDSSSI
jgi:hypothetical protein